jgi:hypothetical protein
LTKYSLLTACLLAVTALSTGAPVWNAPALAEEPPPPPPPPPGMKDVAQILYEVNHGLARQEIIINKTHKALLKAHKAYVLEPGAETYTTLVNSAKADAEAVTIYSDFVDKSAKLEKQLEDAEKYFEGQTPLSKEQMETGPKGVGTPPGGESVASEKGKSTKTIEKKLEKEVQNQPRGSDFAKQLEEQAKTLKPVLKEIQADKNNPAVKTNPEAKKEDDEWFNAVKRSIEAREALPKKLFEQCKSKNPDDWKTYCCPQYPDNRKCKKK